MNSEHKLTFILFQADILLSSDNKLIAPVSWKQHFLLKENIRKLGRMI